MVIFLGLFSMMLIKRVFMSFAQTKVFYLSGWDKKFANFVSLTSVPVPSLRLMHFKHSINCYVSLPCGCKHEYWLQIEQKKQSAADVTFQYSNFVMACIGFQARPCDMRLHLMKVRKTKILPRNLVYQYQYQYYQYL